MTDSVRPSQWTPGQLYQKLEQDERFFVFDVRNEDEYEGWRIEGRGPLPMANVPYYEMLEVDEHDDVVDSFVEFLERGWVEKLPRDRPILAVCAKGDTSELVAQALRRLRFEAFNLEGGTQAWGDHYEVRPIEETESRSVHQVVRPARGCLSYVVAGDSQAAVIDPLRHTRHYQELAATKGLTIRLVMDTHGHADHISGAAALAEATGAPYYLHPYDAIHPIDVLPASISYEYLRHGQKFTLGGVSLRVLHIPGHTLGNVAYLVDDRYVLSGDSIFIQSIARPDLGGKGDTWAPLHHRSLRKLLELPDDVVVLPGHFSSLSEADAVGRYAATLGALKDANHGLLMARRGEREFVDYILGSLPEFPDEYVEIKRVNAGLKQVRESVASELELGKNICALAQLGDR